jgi:hypothetical protein
MKSQEGAQVSTGFRSARRWLARSGVRWVLPIIWIRSAPGSTEPSDVADSWTEKRLISKGIGCCAT